MCVYIPVEQYARVFYGYLRLFLFIRIVSQIRPITVFDGFNTYCKKIHHRHISNMLPKYGPRPRAKNYPSLASLCDHGFTDWNLNTTLMLSVLPSFMLSWHIST